MNYEGPGRTGGDGMIVLEESAETYSVRGADLEISFRRALDRWQHFVSIRMHGETIPLLASEEGTAGDDLLPSPALQDLRVEKLSDDAFEFQLLGQAGKGVYSAAVRFDGAAQVVDFDLCARGRSAESPLCTASRYQIAPENNVVAVQQRSGELIMSCGGDRAVVLSPVPIPGIPSTECRLIGEGTQQRIAAGCSGVTGSDAPQKSVSVRWRYRIALAGHP
jgi:hypothetical protein